jgi:proteasome lid subunit RPN8/RPN11
VSGEGDNGRALRLPAEIARRICEHAERAYPHECCGALLGRDARARREVAEIVPLANRRDDAPRSRYSLSPQDVRAAERAAEEAGLEVVGWYHSHPDHPALPSEYDREHAWPWYSYVIVSVAAGRAGQLTSWRLADDRLRFHHETLETAKEAAA